MPCCVAYNCSNRTDSSSKTSFFKFPLSDEDRLQQWIHNVNRKDWTPNQHSRLCALHFTQDSFIYGPNRIYLTRTAVPTIFYPLCQSKAKVRRTRTCFNTKVVKTNGDAQFSALTDVSHDHDYVSYIHTEQQTKTVVDGASCSHSADHAHAEETDTINLKRKVSVVQNRLLSCKKRLRLQEQRVRRLKRKVKSLSSVITDLKEKLLASSSCGDILQPSFGGVAKEILTRAKCKSKSATVSEDLKSFAMTLHCYSTKAYQFVRESFDCVLPHPQTIRSWNSSIPADPAFAKAHVEEGSKEVNEAVCALVIDEMAIRKHVEYTKERFPGNGCGKVDNTGFA